VKLELAVVLSFVVNKLGLPGNNNSECDVCVGLVGQ
jgi:hypothetical protein